MNDLSALPREKRFKVVCAWCGGIIHSDVEKDALGMCLGCFYKELCARLGTQKGLNSPAASDR